MKDTRKLQHMVAAFIIIIIIVSNEQIAKQSMS